MLKSLIAFVSIFFMGAGGVALDAYAVPSIRQLGTGVSTGAEKPVAALPSLPKTGSEVSRSVKIQTENESDDSARIPALSSMKTISSARIKQPATSTSSSSQPATSGVSGSAFNEVVDRVQALEANNQNVIKGVTESGTGNYVSNVSVGTNNKLKVEKTRVLYAPVRNDGSSAIVGDAEIWLVR